MISYGRVDSSGRTYSFSLLNNEPAGNYGLNLKKGQKVRVDSGYALIKEVGTVINKGEPDKGRPNWIDILLEGDEYVFTAERTKNSVDYFEDGDGKWTL